MPASSARTLVVSRRELDPMVSYAGGYELEDLIVELLGADLVTIRTQETKIRTIAQRLGDRVQRVTGIGAVVPPVRKRVSLDHDYDLAFVRVMTPSELDVLSAIPDLRKRCRVTVCWVEELWMGWFRYEKMLEPLRHFDHVFVSLAATADPLGSRVGRPCSYMAPGVNTLRFCPYADPPSRSIAAYSMGRRAPRTHLALLERARSDRSFFYLYDSAHAREFVDGHVQHRELLASLIARSRYFVVNKAKANEPSHTSGQEEFGPRFFEGAAAGAVLIGDAPRTGHFLSYFDWRDAVFQLPYDSPDIVDLIDELDAHPERVSAASQRNVVQSLRRHDWVYRLEEILRKVGMTAPPSLRARRLALEKRAAEIDRSPVGAFDDGAKLIASR
jgi:hypothetical protein